MIPKLELFWPLKKYVISQNFGDNANPLYAGQGLKGHPGMDLQSFWDDPIMAAHNSFVYKRINVANHDLSMYRAVFTLIDTDQGTYELVYGHCHLITASQGPVSTGNPLATEGNTGDVYANAIQVTEAEKEAGSHAGTHLHFQLRPVLKVLAQSAGKQYLTTEANANLSYRDADGYFYEVINYDNGYNGCVDPLPFMANASADVVPQVSALTILVQKLIALFKGRNPTS